MKIIKKTLFLLLALFIGLNLYAQEKCNTVVISQRIDSICKINNVTQCKVFYYYDYEDPLYPNSGDERQVTGEFILDDCFLIVNEQYFNLDKMTKFYLRINKKNPEASMLMIYF